MSLARTPTCVFVAAILGVSSHAVAQTLPDEAEISINNSGFILHFSWSTDPAFSSNTAVEFEVHIDNPCFAAPQGGKDETLQLRGIKTNLPGDGIYRDVWNWYQPADAKTAVAEVRKGCHWRDTQATRLLYDRLGRIINDDGNFAVGVPDASRLRAGVRYYIAYELDNPYGYIRYGVDNTQCYASVAGSRARVRMETLPNTCSFLGISSSCPYFWGAPQCDEYPKIGARSYSFHEQLCVPTGPYAFTPGVHVNTEAGTCIDKDRDGWFEQSSSVPMFGTQVGDCNDNDPSVTASAGGCAQCGDGAAENGEACDGADLRGQTCAAHGFDGGTLVCTSNCALDTRTCCDNTCISGSHRCADAVEETCTDQDRDGCTEWVQSASCAYGCIGDVCGAGPICGDGVHQGSESCDGTDLNGKTCKALAFSAGTLACASNCVFDTASCCNDACSVAATKCTLGVQQTCGFWNGAACLGWGNDLPCSAGCSGSICAACATVYSQDFETSVINDVVGSQKFTDGSEFWDCCGTSRARQISGQGSGSGFGLYMGSSGAAESVTLSFPANISGAQTAKVSFWAYSNAPQAYDLVLQRAGANPVTATIQPGEWRHVTASLSSKSYTGAIVVQMGLAPNSTDSGWILKIDNVVIEACQ